MRFLILYLFALLTGILLAGALNAQPRGDGVQPGYEIWGTSTGLPELWFTEPKEGETHAGTITHYNQNTSPNNMGYEMVTLETPFGPVTMRLDRTPNNDCQPVKPCPDTLEIYDLPAGMIAIPQSHIIDEESFGHIKLYEYTGM